MAVPWRRLPRRSTCRAVTAQGAEQPRLPAAQPGGAAGGLRGHCGTGAVGGSLWLSVQATSSLLGAGHPKVREGHSPGRRVVEGCYSRQSGARRGCRGGRTGCQLGYPVPRGLRQRKPGAARGRLGPLGALGGLAGGHRRCRGRGARRGCRRRSPGWGW